MKRKISILTRFLTNICKNFNFNLFIVTILDSMKIFLTLIFILVVLFLLTPISLIVLAQQEPRSEIKEPAVCQNIQDRVDSKLLKLQNLNQIPKKVLELAEEFLEIASNAGFETADLDVASSELNSNIIDLDFQKDTYQESLENLKAIACTDSDQNFQVALQTANQNYILMRNNYGNTKNLIKNNLLPAIENLKNN